MLKHLNKTYKKPHRAVILGGGGFVSREIEKNLKFKNISCLSLPRKKLDLLKKNSTKKLSKILNSKDVIIFVAAKAPVKNEKMFLHNLLICETVCTVIKKKKIKHLVYISSDAIYADDKKPLKEKSIKQPNSLHGLMHLTREIMLKNSFKGPICFIRPTLIYGNRDPHNGYGPNRFTRLAKQNKTIELFGNGEELRDHVWVEDVAELTSRIILKKSKGAINVATGKVVSFLELAKNIITLTNSRSKIKKKKKKSNSS